MKSNNVIKTKLFHLVFYVALSCMSTLSLAESNGDETHEHEEEGHIELTQQQIKHAEIDLSSVASGNIRETLSVYGVISKNSEQIQLVSARFGGVIRSVHKKIGDQIRKGETLVKVEANDSLKTYSITASLNGEITQRHANLGEQTADRVLFVIEDFSTVWVDLSLFPKDVAKIKLGQVVRIKNANNALTGKGQITYIAPLGNRNNQATIARVLMNNKHKQWRPGLFVNAEITLSEMRSPLVVRNEAIQFVEDNSVVFVKGDDGFEPRPVTLGRTDGELSEVVRGLTKNEIYVSKNSFVLKSEMGKGSAEHGH